MRKDLHAPVVERIGKPMSRTIHGIHTELPAKLCHDRHPVCRLAEPAMDEHDGRPVTEFEHLSLAMGRADSSHRAGRVLVQRSSLQCPQLLVCFPIH